MELPGPGEPAGDLNRPFSGEEPEYSDPVSAAASGLEPRAGDRSGSREPVVALQESGETAGDLNRPFSGEEPEYSDPVSAVASGLEPRAGDRSGSREPVVALQESGETAGDLSRPFSGREPEYSDPASTAASGLEPRAGDRSGSREPVVALQESEEPAGDLHRSPSGEEAGRSSHDTLAPEVRAGDRPGSGEPEPMVLDLLQPEVPGVSTDTQENSGSGNPDEGLFTPLAGPSLDRSRWTVTLHTESPFAKVGRLYLAGDSLVIRSDLDGRGFSIALADVVHVLDGETGPVRLISGGSVVGSARTSLSGKAMNISIPPFLYTTPLRSLSPVLDEQVRKAPLFVGREVVEG
ncbi:hypothetical protein ASZ90_016117 [hydrocarbon metagenome]|uniref:Uncharacterized protein n=1 Tax=hydrocarbon metagenome TaxID=938273 RepID=A0A0W8F035_9ZZZZ